MIKLSSIKLHGMEGRTEWGNKTFTTFEAFQRHMSYVARCAKSDLMGREWLGYYKADVTLTWEDGETYKARYDMGETGLADGETLAEHIRNLCEFYLGLRKPRHLTFGQYRAIVDETPTKEKENMMHFLNNYDLGNESLIPV